MKKIKLELTFEEGSDEFWESLREENKTGCDEILKIVKGSLESWPEIDIRVTEYTDK